MNWKIFRSATCVSFALLLFASSASAKEWFVNNTGGSDDNSGVSERRPFKTIAKALKVSEQGDRIILANSGEPYRETIRLAGKNKSGTGTQPFMVIGNGAVLDGRKDVSSDQWEHFEGNVFRFRPERMSNQLLYRDDRPAPKVSVKTRDEIKTALTAGKWTSFKGWIYFCVDPSVDPINYDLSYCNLTVGVSLYRVDNVVVKDLVVQGFQLDGLSCHDLTRNVVFNGLNSRGNGRSGVHVGGASRLVIEDCLVGDNGGAQVRTEGYCKVDIKQSNLLESEVYGDPIVVEGGRVTVDGKKVEKK